MSSEQLGKCKTPKLESTCVHNKKRCKKCLVQCCAAGWTARSPCSSSSSSGSNAPGCGQRHSVTNKAAQARAAGAREATAHTPLMRTHARTHPGVGALYPHTKPMQARPPGQRRLAPSLARGPPRRARPAEVDFGKQLLVIVVSVIHPSAMHPPRLGRRPLALARRLGRGRRPAGGMLVWSCEDLHRAILLCMK